MIEYESLSVEALEKKLAEQKDLLEEVEEERAIILGQENLHMSSRIAIKYNDEVQEIREDIEKIENLIKQKK